MRPGRMRRKGFRSGAIRMQARRGTVPKPPPRQIDASGMFHRLEGARANWIETDPEKGWVKLLRLYRPMPAIFDKS